MVEIQHLYLKNVSTHLLELNGALQRMYFSLLISFFAYFTVLL